ncbi:hypothetical protein ACFS6H_00590 [Terrimonas rubra]|uniref:DUF4329 domain-containing protein n=1 Tax=Terrimonas rubra TaxID=1035890 RepID=A0ABW6A0T5_9BACT
MNCHYTKSLPGFTALLCVLWALLFQTCKKTDKDVTAEDELITTAPHALTGKNNKQVAKVFKELSQRGLNEGAFARYGKLLWDKSIVLPYSSIQSPAYNTRVDSGVDAVVIVPIVPGNAQEVTAYLQAWIGDMVSLAIYTKDHYTGLAFGNTVNNGIGEAEKLALQFMRLNKHVFNYTDFKITDKRLFTGNIPNDTAKAGMMIKLREPGNNITGRLRYVELCVDIIRTNCTTPTAPQCKPTCDNCPGYCQTTERVCTGWWEDDSPGGGEGPSLPNPGEGGGTNPPGPGNPCGGGRIIGARLPPCGGGGGGTGGGSGGGGWIPIVPDENQWSGNTPDSALIKASLAINKLADSIYKQLSVPNNWEYMFPIFGKNENITTGMVRTDQQENSVTPKNMVKPGWQTIGMWHGHQGNGAETARMPHSHADIDYLRRHAATKNFISFVDCGNKRFALIITDVVKAKQFFVNNNELQIYSNYKLPSGPQSGTIQHLRSLCVTNAIGSITNNGIGFYSADGPNFDNFILLNP